MGFKQTREHPEMHEKNLCWKITRVDEAGEFASG